MSLLGHYWLSGLLHWYSIIIGLLKTFTGSLHTHCELVTCLLHAHCGFLYVDTSQILTFTAVHTVILCSIHRKQENMEKIHSRHMKKVQTLIQKLISDWDWNLQPLDDNAIL